MFLKCIRCTQQTTVVQVSALRRFRTSTAFYFCNDKDKPTDRDNISDRYVPPKKRSIFKALKDYRENNMTIDQLPENESISSILKVQRANQTIPKDFKTIYKFPPIKYFGLVNRLKLYQTIITVIASLGSATLYACGIFSQDFVLISTVLGMSGCLMFYSLGYVTARFIGFMYYNDKTEMVRIAYVDFWGRRRDIEVPVSDIIPRDESVVGLINKVWFPLRRYSTKEILKLQLEQGIILNQKALKRIL